MTPLVFLDTETTGVHPDRQVWEIAMIRRDDAGQREFSCFVEIDLSRADPFGLKIGGFYDRHPWGKYLSGTVAGRQVPSDGWALSDFLEKNSAAEIVARMTHGAHIVGAVPNFDTETLAPLLRESGLIPAWHYHLVDVENLAVGFLAGKGIPIAPPWRSDDLSALIGVEPATPEQRHTALGDASWAMRIYDAVIGGERRG